MLLVSVRLLRRNVPGVTGLSAVVLVIMLGRDVLVWHDDGVDVFEADLVHRLDIFLVQESNLANI